MSGTQICKKIAKENNLSEAMARKILFDALMEIENIVSTTGRCQIRGFGTFKLKTYASRRSHDYVTKTIIELPKKIKLVFEHSRERTTIFKLL